MKGFLNEDQVFIKGQYKGENLDDVVMDDPDYIEFILLKHELNEDEKNWMKEALRIYGGK